MVNPLIGIHAAIGELGAIAFLWVLIEFWNPAPNRIKRAELVALIGAILLFLTWFVGGYYYVQYYGANVKPIIKEGPQPWAHGVFTETKEHVFLFMPFLALLDYLIIKKYGKNITEKSEIRKAVMLLSLLIFLLALSMAGMGYIISTGARAALEAGAL